MASPYPMTCPRVHQKSLWMKIEDEMMWNWSSSFDRAIPFKRGTEQNLPTDFHAPVDPATPSPRLTELQRYRSFVDKADLPLSNSSFAVVRLTHSRRCLHPFSHLTKSNPVGGEDVLQLPAAFSPFLV